MADAAIIITVVRNYPLLSVSRYQRMARSLFFALCISAGRSQRFRGRSGGRGGGKGGGGRRGGSKGSDDAADAVTPASSSKCDGGAWGANAKGQRTFSVSSLHDTRLPSQQNIVDIFRGEWATSVLPGFDTNTTGAAFMPDARITWLLSKPEGQVAGKHILELGPHHCGNTYQLSNAGAASLLAIEVKQDAILQCLVIKEIYGLSNVHFLLGDFNKYLGMIRGGARARIPHHRSHYDLVAASGVLYHMTKPYAFLRSVLATTDTLYVWTHVYKPSLLEPLPPTRPVSKAEEFTGEPEVLYTKDDRQFRGFKRIYTDHVLGLGGQFIGGAEAFSYWLPKEDLFAFVELCGFNVVHVAFEQELEFGPAIAFIAQRKRH